MKEVISMCKSGGFNLTKFVSNSKGLVQSIPEQQKRQGTKDQDLSGDFPTNKTIGISWNIADDTFSFKIKLDRRSLTKRTMLSMIHLVLQHHLCWRGEGFCKISATRIYLGIQK